MRELEDAGHENRTLALAWPTSVEESKEMKRVHLKLIIESINAA
jgi:hypothetical protein